MDSLRPLAYLYRPFETGMSTGRRTIMKRIFEVYFQIRLLYFLPSNKIFSNRLLALSKVRIIARDL